MEHNGEESTRDQVQLYGHREEKDSRRFGRIRHLWFFQNLCALCQVLGTWNEVRIKMRLEIFNPNAQKNLATVAIIMTVALFKWNAQLWRTIYFESLRFVLENAINSSFSATKVLELEVWKRCSFENIMKMFLKSFTLSISNTRLTKLVALKTSKICFELLTCCVSACREILYNTWRNQL